MGRGDDKLLGGLLVPALRLHFRRRHAWPPRASPARISSRSVQNDPLPDAFSALMLTGEAVASVEAVLEKELGSRFECCDKESDRHAQRTRMVASGRKGRSAGWAVSCLEAEHS